MTFPQVYDLFDYWAESPPEHEILAMFARVYTTWKPPGGDSTGVAHQKSLEQRWAAGYLSPAQLFKMQGGAGFGMKTNGDPADMPGIGRFPGAPPPAP